MKKFLFTAIFCSASLLSAGDFHDWAKTPPMGWNSFDCFGTTITEEKAKSQANAQAEILKPFGWKLFTVDIQWYEDNSKGHGYKAGAVLTMDEYGRLLPGPTKFPSSKNGRGFKPLADYVHSKGLNFGIHIMRGIPRQAVEKNLPIKGTNLRAQDIALRGDTCCWNPDMYGIDMKKDGAQAYYDSIFQMYASWGVDFVKVDDISRPYNEIQQLEIEAIRKAIDKTGRKIVLSLSPGDTPLAKGNHVNKFVNMWRVSDDFWDRWQPLHGMFRRLERWSEFRKVGSWPDADMLPFGIVDFNRPTKFTKDEQITCMTLWCIARSPLILGADMERMDEWTKKLLTNREVLSVNQNSSNNRQLFRKGDHIAWVADVPDSKDKYVALFNADTEGVKDVEMQKARYMSIQIGKAGEREAKISVNISGKKKLALVVNDNGDGFSYDHVAWLNPVLSGVKGKLKLTDLKWKSATAGWGEPRANLTTDGMVIDGIGTHANSMIVYDLPEGYETFSATAVLTDGNEEKGSVDFAVLTDEAFGVDIPNESEISVDLEELGFKGNVVVKDLWSGKNLGKFKGKFSRKLKCHRSGLYRISPLK